MLRRKTTSTGISVAVLANIETIPVDTTVAVEISLRRVMRSDCIKNAGRLQGLLGLVWRRGTSVRPSRSSASLDGETVGHIQSYFPPFAVNDSWADKAQDPSRHFYAQPSRVSHPQTPLTTMSSGIEYHQFCDSSGARRHSTVSALWRRRREARCARLMACASCRAPKWREYCIESEVDVVDVDLLAGIVDAENRSRGLDCLGSGEGIVREKRWIIA
jgi:hypothetical protein